MLMRVRSILLCTAVCLATRVSTVAYEVSRFGRLPICLCWLPMAISSGEVAVSCCGTKEGCAIAGDVFERLHDAQNRHDLDAFLACFDSDNRGDQPLHPDRAFTGSEQVRRNWAAVLIACWTSVPSWCVRRRGGRHLAGVVLAWNSCRRDTAGDAGGDDVRRPR
jgi:hypothetical protein